MTQPKHPFLTFISSLFPFTFSTTYTNSMLTPLYVLSLHSNKLHHQSHFFKNINKSNPESWHIYWDLGHMKCKPKIWIRWRTQLSGTSLVRQCHSKGIKNQTYIHVVKYRKWVQGNVTPQRHPLQWLNQSEEIETVLHMSRIYGLWFL